MNDATHTRRRFLALLPAAWAAIFLSGRTTAAATHRTACRRRVPDGPGDPGIGQPDGPDQHPDPRPGIDASNVLPDEEVPARAQSAFRAVREIPQVVDGIRCHCGCAEIPEMYSLLSCYEGMAMARYCEICQGQARLAHELHGEGRSLDEIRAAIDERYG